MESKTRLLAKSVSWQVAGLFSMTAVGFVFTGSVAAGSGIALAGALVGFVCYFAHELVWARIGWGRHPRQIGPARMPPLK